jgi:hypothetical protein
MRIAELQKMGLGLNFIQWAIESTEKLLNYSLETTDRWGIG